MIPDKQLDKFVFQAINQNFIQNQNLPENIVMHCTLWTNSNAQFSHLNFGYFQGPPGRIFGVYDDYLDKDLKFSLLVVAQNPPQFLSNMDS